MFDDKQQNPGQVPGNLPTGDPEDILAGTDSASDVPPTSGEDASFGTEPPAPAQPSALASGVLRPKNSPDNNFGVPQPSTPTPSVGGSDVNPVDDIGVPTPPISPSPVPQPAPAQPISSSAGPSSLMPDNLGTGVSPAQPISTTPTGETGERDYNLKEPIGSRKTIMWIVVIVIVVVLGAGSLWIYFSFIRGGEELENGFETAPADSVNDFGDNQPTQPVLPDPEVTEVVDNSVEDTESPEIDLEDSILFGEPIDTDGDGLDDIREADLNTDPLNWDTDGDALADGHEVVIWKTDPFNPDTDGDGYEDGEEIDNGYSPTGPGKLFQPPTTTEE